MEDAAEGHKHMMAHDTHAKASGMRISQDQYIEFWLVWDDSDCHEVQLLNSIQSSAFCRSRLCIR